jgi:competence protein ComEC
MRNKKLIYILIFALFAIGLILAGIIGLGRNQELKIIFLDVGQGDAILIEQGGNQILIDGGPSEQVLMEKLGRFIPFWDRKIETLIATHPDKDHIAGLMAVMKNYQVGTIINSRVPQESEISQEFEKLISQEKITEIAGEPGLKVSWPNGASLKIVEAKIAKDTNQGSVVARLNFGENSFLFTGDITENEEKDLMAKIPDSLAADFLKVAHHGSKYATSTEFLDSVKPKEAIISVGKNNRYGHPTAEVLGRLEERGINILRTDQSGDIIYNCPGIEDDCFREK